MRKILTSSMIAGAALLVAACGDNETATNNALTTDLGNDSSMDLNATDMGMDMNMGDMNMTGNGVDAALDNAAAATENAAAAIENAQDANQ